MSYEKQTWVNGEVITADKLNHMENGIGDNSVFIVEVETGNPPTNPTATFSEMEQALLAGKTLVLRYLNMPKQYGNQFDDLQFTAYYDYGQGSSNTAITFEGYIGSTHKFVKCNALDVWTQYTE